MWDPEANEIIEGAKVTLAMPDGSVRETQTDDFGDFWFRRIEGGRYGLRIEAEGFKPQEREVVLDKSLNLGDFPLGRA